MITAAPSRGTRTEDRFPAAYVRKSKKLEESAAAQLEAIKTIAKRDGVNGELRVYSDVGLSGRFGQRGEGSAWRKLQADLDARLVSAVYITVVDRASRSLEDWAGFRRRLQEGGVRLIDQNGEVDLTPGLSKSAIDLLVAEAEGEKAKERSARANATQTARGDRFGHPPYGYSAAREEGTGRVTFVPNPDEPLEPIFAAVKETRGKILTACRLLNERGIRTRGGTPWDPKTVTRILKREGQDHLRTRPVAFTGPDGETRTRRVPVGAHPLSRLVRCHCGTWLTPNRLRKELICYKGHRVGKETHGRWAARERHILDYLREHTADLRGRIQTDTHATDEAATRRQALEAEKRRLGIALADDAIDPDDYRTRMDRVKADLAALADAPDEYVIRVHHSGRLVRWELLDTDPEALGEQLRAVVRWAQLDEAMMPVGIALRD